MWGDAVTVEFADGNDVVISYQWLEGTSEPQSVGQFIGVIEDLKRMHDMGICHGDIRLFNIVFGPERGRLIDFVFAGKAGERMYPHSFALQLNDGARHERITPEAIAKGLTLEKKDDLYAQAWVMEQFEIVDKEENKEDTWKQRVVASRWASLMKLPRR